MESLAAYEPQQVVEAANRTLTNLRKHREEEWERAVESVMKTKRKGWLRKRPYTREEAEVYLRTVEDYFYITPWYRIWHLSHGSQESTAKNLIAAAKFTNKFYLSIEDAKRIGLA